jgi:hypothetical protein
VSPVVVFYQPALAPRLQVLNFGHFEEQSISLHWDNIGLRLLPTACSGNLKSHQPTLLLPDITYRPAFDLSIFPTPNSYKLPTTHFCCQQTDSCTLLYPIPTSINTNSPNINMAKKMAKATRSKAEVKANSETATMSIVSRPCEIRQLRLNLPQTNAINMDVETQTAPSRKRDSSLNENEVQPHPTWLCSGSVRLILFLG